MKNLLCRSAWTDILYFSCIFLCADVEAQAAKNEHESVYDFKKFFEEAAVQLQDIYAWRYVKIYLGETVYVTIDVIFILILIVLLFIMVMKRLL